MIRRPFGTEGASASFRVCALRTSDSFERFLLENPDQARIILDKAMTASRARVAAKKARELTRRKGGLEQRKEMDGEAGEHI